MLLCRSNFDSKPRCIISNAIHVTFDRKGENFKCFFPYRILHHSLGLGAIDSPASSPFIRNFSYVGMECFLDIWPIVVNLSILFCTRIIAGKSPENLDIKQIKTEALLSENYNKHFKK